MGRTSSHQEGNYYDREYSYTPTKSDYGSTSYYSNNNSESGGGSLVVGVLAIILVLSALGVLKSEKQSPKIKRLSLPQGLPRQALSSEHLSQSQGWPDNPSAHRIAQTSTIKQVIPRNLTLRREPTTQSEIIGTLPQKAEVTLLNERRNSWVNVRVGMKKGWVKEKYLE